MKKLFSLLLCALMLSLCACQKTPDEEYVVNKGDNKAEEIINQTALPIPNTEPPNSDEPESTQAEVTPGWQNATGQAVFPEHWDFNIMTEYKEMIISADIVTSGMNAYPVNLVRKTEYTAEEFLKVAAYLFQGKELTGWRSGTKPSKEYLTEAMQYIVNADMTEEDKAINLEMLNSSLNGSNISDADNTPCASVADIPVSSIGGTFSVFTSNGGGNISLSEGNISADTNLYCVVQPKSWFRDSDPDAPKFSAELGSEQAKAKADEFLAYMAIDGFELYSSEEARCVNIYTTEVYDTGWQLRYTRSFGYVPFSVSLNDASVDGPFSFDGKWGRSVTEYFEPIREEGITLYVTENGIEAVNMHDPYEYVATVNENVQLFDFEELTDRIQLIFGAAINNPYSAEGYYKLEEMILTVVPTAKKDSSDFYMMPVWVCKIGEYISLGDGLGLSHFYIPGEQLFEQWLTIAFNAIDGTRVSLPRG